MSILETFIQPHDDYGPVPVWHWQKGIQLDQILSVLHEYRKQGITECVVDARALMELPDVYKKPIYTFCHTYGLRLWLYIKGWISTPTSDLIFTTLRLVRYPIFENRLLNLAQYDYAVRAVILQKEDKFQIIPNVSAHDQLVVLSDEADQVLLFQEQEYAILEEEKEDLAFYYDYFKEELNHAILGFFVDPIGFYRLVRDIASSSQGKKVLWHPKLLQEHKEFDFSHVHQLWFDDPTVVSRFRVHYYLSLNQLFKTHYSNPIQKFCKEKNVQLLGRFHFDEFLNESIQNYRHSDISTAIFSYAEKLTSSASWLSGEKRTISETYAFSQWESTLEKMKANADWEYLKGIDKVLLYGDPDDPSVVKHSYWKHFSYFSDYIKRMGYVLANTKRVCNVAVFYPIKTSYGLMAPNEWAQVDQIESLLSELSNLLTAHQIDHNFINHDKLMEDKIPFEVIVFCRCQCLYLAELARMQHYVDQGGSVLFLHTIPSTSVEQKYQDAFDLAVAKLLRSERVHYLSPEEITNPLTFSMNLQPASVIFQNLSVSDVQLLDPDPEIHIVHREAENKHFYLIVNTGTDIKNNAVIFPDQDKLEMWDAETGKVQPTRVRYHEKKDTYSIHMYPHESKLFVHNPEKDISPSSVFVFHNGNYNMGGIPLTVSGIPSSFVLRGDWTIQFGEEEPFLSHLSSLQQLTNRNKGFFQVKYRKTFTLPNEYSHFGLVIDLGEVRDNAEVFFNGVSYGFRFWSPYRFPIFKTSSKGENTLEIHLTGIIHEKIMGLTRREGLLGPVKIIPYQAL